MKKMLFVFNHPAPYKVRLFNELSKHFDLTVIFERNSSAGRNDAFYFEHDYRFKTVKIPGIKLGKENFVSNGITEHLKKNKYDIVVINGYSTIAEMSALFYLKKNKIPYILYINGGIIRENEFSLKRKLKTALISNAIAYLSPDKESNKYLIYYGANKDKIFNYPYSTIYESEINNKPLSTKDKKSEREKLGINFDKLFVSSGQLIKRKNYFELIQAWEKIPKTYGLYIFGDGTKYQNLKKYITNQKLDNIKLCGFKNRNEQLKFFSIADAFAFPSNEDIYGHVVNEALSQGLPVISTNNVNATKKLIMDGENGYIVKSVLSKEFLNAIECITSKDFSKNCIKTAKENTIELMVDAHIKIFDEVYSK